MRLHLDYETASELNIKQTGAYAYAAHPSTRVLMLGWADGDGLVHLWEPHKDEMPAQLRVLLLDPNYRKHAYNAAFERLITKHCLGIDIPAEQWRCTMVESYYLGFAGSLNMVLKAVGLEEKDARGNRLINMFSTPAPKNHKADWYDWDNKPQEWQEFCEYCVQDVTVERKLWHWLQQFPSIRPWDYAQWCLDQRINDRGVPMDVDMAYAAIELWEAEKASLTSELSDMTGLPKVTRTPFLEWMKTHTGVELESTRKDYLASLLKSGGLPDAARPYVDLWAQKEAKATSKYQAILNGTGEDGRARGMFQYKGASRTDRVGGRLIQLQNLKRPFVKNEGINALVRAIKTKGAGLLKMLYDMPISAVLGGSIRHAISAPEGKSFAICDLTSIESVILGWIAQCPSIDETFRDGRDSYKMFASKYYDIDYDDVTKEQRSFSKPPVLGCFAEDTLVLTDKGYVPILHVSTSHRVFDGVEFVEHDGVVDQGVKDVISRHGVTATADHKFLVEEGTWISFEDLTDVKAKQATSTARGLLKNMWATGSTGVSANVEALQMCKDLTSATEGPALAYRVLIQNSHDNDPLPPYLGLLKQTMTDSLTGTTLPKRDVSTLGTARTVTMEQEASRWASKMLNHLSSTSLPYRVGKSLTLKLIESITTKGMKQGMSVSLIEAETAATRGLTATSYTTDELTPRPSSGDSSRPDIVTKARSQGKSERGTPAHRSSLTNLGAKVRTYDILNAGPRNRFTILTAEGPMIVHNCGFMLGWKGLMAYAEGYGVDMTADQAKGAVNTFRGMYPEIPLFWKWIYDAVKTVTTTGQVVTGYRLTIERDEHFLRIWLPSGRALSYYLPQVKQRKAPWRNMLDAANGVEYEEFIKQGWTDDLLVEKGYMKEPQMLMNFSYMGMNDKNQWCRIFAHAGLITENIVQSIAGDILWSGITNAEAAGLPVVLHVHDEIAAQVDDSVKEQALTVLQECMIRKPEWAQDMWLGADGFTIKRYTKD